MYLVVIVGMTFSTLSIAEMASIAPTAYGETPAPLLITVTDTKTFRQWWPVSLGQRVRARKASAVPVSIVHGEPRDGD
jgi:hypothetical protein